MWGNQEPHPFKKCQCTRAERQVMCFQSPAKSLKIVFNVPWEMKGYLNKSKVQNLWKNSWKLIILVPPLHYFSGCHGSVPPLRWSGLERASGPCPCHSHMAHQPNHWLSSKGFLSLTGRHRLRYNWILRMEPGLTFSTSDTSQSMLSFPAPPLICCCVSFIF